MKATQDSTPPAPEATVQRFSPGLNGTSFVGMMAVPEGEWVRYEDFDKIRRKWQNLEESLAMDLLTQFSGL